MLEHHKLIPIGTVTFVEVDNRDYLLTTAHLLDNVAGRDWGIAQAGDYQSTLDFMKVIPPNNIRSEDRWDFAFAPVDRGWRESGIEPLAITDGIDVETISVCMAAGYPTSKNELKHKIVQPDLRNYTTTRVPSLDERYSALGVNADTHLVAFFDGKQSFVNGERVNTFNPRGMSGGLFFGWSGSDVAILSLGIAVPMKPAALIMQRSKRHGVLFCPSLRVIASEIQRATS